MTKWNGYRLLVKSVIKKNRRLSIGLWGLFFLMTVIVITALVLPKTVECTLENFLKDYRMPEGWVTTQPLAIGDYKTDGISSYEADFAADMFVYDKSDRLLSFRVFSMSENSNKKYYTVEKSKNNTAYPSVYVTAKFAEYSGIHTGDILSVKTLTGSHKIYVESLVSLPEALVCTRNDGSWQDAEDFGYAYLPRKDYDSIFRTNGIANQWFVSFDDGLTQKQKEDALSEFAKKIGAEADSAVLFENSEVRHMLDNTIDTLAATCRYFPMAIFVIGLFFAGLFVRQLVLYDRKKIGLLMALGYSANQILFIFLRYILLLSVCAIVPGILAGVFTVRATTEIFREMYVLPRMDYSYSLFAIIAFLLAIILVGVVSCLVSARHISEVDPSEAYGNTQEDFTELPQLFSKFHIQPIVKIVLGSIIRNKSNFIRSVISIGACIALMICALLYYASQNEVFPVTFGERFRYDFTVSVNSADRVEQELKDIACISETEPVTTFREELSFNGETKSVLVCALRDNAKLIVPSDASENALYPENGIILDEWTAKNIDANENDTVLLGDVSLTVLGISRELVNSTQYISEDTAALLGRNIPESFAVKLDEGADTDAVEKEIAGIPECTGITYLEHQQQSYYDMIRLVNIIIMLIVGISLILGIVILYNMVALNILKRQRTNATLSVLGATGKEFAVIAMCENAILYFLALIPACPTAYFASKFLLTIVSSDAGGQYLPIVHFWEIIVISAVLSLIYLTVGILVTLNKIRKTDLAVALNSSE